FEQVGVRAGGQFQVGADGGIEVREDVAVDRNAVVTLRRKFGKASGIHGGILEEMARRTASGCGINTNGHPGGRYSEVTIASVRSHARGRHAAVCGSWLSPRSPGLISDSQSGGL